MKVFDINCFYCKLIDLVLFFLPLQLFKKIDLKLTVQKDIKRFMQEVGIKIRNARFIYSSLKLNFSKLNDA